MNAVGVSVAGFLRLAACGQTVAAENLPPDGQMPKTAAVSRTELPRVSLADNDAADLGKGWSAVKADGDVKFREAVKGETATFSVKVCWDGPALRPPENTQYVLEIRYKDTAVAPVVFWTFGGLARYQGPTEVHRFGGTGDGQWKTIAVPVGWDQILR